MSIGERIKDARKHIGMTQTALGEKIGVSGNTITQWEKGSREPNVLAIIKLSRTLGVTGDWLLDMEDNNSQFSDILPDETELITCYRSVNPEGKRAILKNARSYADDPEYQNLVEEQMAT